MKMPNIEERPLVLRVLTRLGAGGPPIHATTVTRQLAGMGYGSVLATGRCDAADGDMSYLLREGDPICWIPEMSRQPSLFDDLQALWRLFSEMRRLRPDIVHTHTAKAGALGRVAALMAGVPVVVHTFHGNVLSGYFSKPVSKLVAFVERLLAHGTDAICVLAPQQKRDIAETHRIANPEKVHVIPLGMDLDEFANLPAPAFHKSCLTVGWLGRLVAVKDVPLLAAVIAETLERTSNVRFVIAGDGPERPVVEAVAARFGSDRVRFLGWQRAVAPVIAQCDLLLQTSRNEGTPVALIQGMAAGRPFLATPVGGIPDMAGERICEASGVSWRRHGILVPPQAGAFASVLAELAADPVRMTSMGEAARDFALQQNSVSSLMSRLDRLYTRLLLDAALRRRKQVVVES